VVTTRPTLEPAENFKTLPTTDASVAADITRKHPVHHDLRDIAWGGLCVCVCVCEPKPECQQDRGRGDTREECRLGLIRALLSGLRFLSITESGAEERDGGVWLEFQRALTRAALSSSGWVWFGWFYFFSPSPNRKVRICGQTEERRETFCKPEQRKIFLLQLLFQRGRHQLAGKQRDSCEEVKIIGDEEIKKAKSQL